MLRTRPQVTVVGRVLDRRTEAVAAVLADGSIVPLASEVSARVDERLDGWSEGMVRGTGWTLWWQRRGA